MLRAIRQQVALMRFSGGASITILLVMFGSLAHAASYQSHSSIREAIHRYLLVELADSEDEITVKVGRLDKRLRLKQCEAPVNISLPPSAQRVGGVTVKVSCEQGSSWTIYVQSEVVRFGYVMVAKRALHRGEIISQEDIEPRRASLGLIRGGYITKTENILDWEARKNIAIGKIVSPNAIRRPLLVKRGDVVVIIVKSKTLEVKMSGIAKSSGAKGETIRVINRSSKKVVEGVVIKAGVVQVPM